ncbi:hypothetical protein PMAYCL1PPCAC_14233, partial [Pristionchus mayeri]
MTSFSYGNLEDSCLQALGAAIADSAKVCDSTGVPLRRSIAEFVTFTTRLEDEMEGSAPEQLEHTLKSINNFHRALGITRASLERIIHAASDTDNGNNEIYRSDSMDDDMGKHREVGSAIDNTPMELKEEPIDVPPFNQGDEMPLGSDFIGDEIKEEEILNDG